ncbi:MAG: helicase SNF2 [Gammaproteobacteria bacterium]|nr:MAG: helicase SNF2 [Gammaproteobacteria bacterium]
MTLGIPLTLTQLQDFFDPVYYNRGVSYVRAEMVRMVKVMSGGRRLISRVQGSGRNLYSCDIELVIPEGRVENILGICSCPVGFNCKHVVASLYHQILLQERSPADPGNELPFGLRQWFERLETVKGQGTPRRSGEEQLHFLLDVHESESGRSLQVETRKTRWLKSKRWSVGSLFSGGSRSPAAFLQETDSEVLRLLESFDEYHGPGDGRYLLAPGISDYLLARLIETGKVHWQQLGGSPLERGEPLAARLGWELQPDGSLRLEIAECALEDVQLLPLSPPWYVAPSIGRAGPLETGLEARAAGLLASAPVVPARFGRQLERQLKKVAPDHAVQVPRLEVEEAREDVVPVPHLLLGAQEHRFHYLRGLEDYLEGYAVLHFEYDGHRVHPDDAEEVKAFTGAEGKVQQIHRHLDQEEAFVDRLWDMGLIPRDVQPAEREGLSFEHELEDEGWVEFSLLGVPLLKEEGWQIDIDPSFAWQVKEPDAWYADLEEESGGDWFDLELGVSIEGKRISLLPMLVQYIANQRKAGTLQDFLNTDDEVPLLVNLRDGEGKGAILKLPYGKVRPIIQTLVELYDPKILDADGRLRMSRYQAAELNTLAETDLEWGGAEAPRKFAEKLAGFRELEAVPPPTGLKAELRPYQQQGLNWLQFLRQYGLSGILADDMGLGKTVQALAHLLVEKESGRAEHPSLVVATTSLMVNWASEAARFAPSLKVLVLQGPERRKRFQEIADHDLVLTTYPLLPRDSKVLLEQTWHLVILDEAQHIKNPRSKVAQTACKLKAKHRLCLTGTPMENHLGELWSQFHFLMPGLLGDERRFRTLFRNPIEKEGDQQRQQLLNRRIAPFMLRRDKREVVAELPEKTEIPVLVELEGKQRQLYETIRVAMDERVRKEIDRKGLERSQIVILDALLKLRQVCCDPRLLKMEAARKVTASAKLAQLMEMLPEMIDEGRRILLFSQFTSMLKLIEGELEKHSIPWVKLTGNTRDRATPVQRFQEREVPLFLISLKAGGAGLNLTAADTVIHYDPWWNPAVERQATDRAHRIGQENPVFVYKLVASGTVEEKINALQQKKQALADALFDGSKKGGVLTREDLQNLFEPLD